MEPIPVNGSSLTSGRSTRYEPHQHSSSELYRFRVHRAPVHSRDPIERTSDMAGAPFPRHPVLRDALVLHFQRSYRTRRAPVTFVRGLAFAAVTLTSLWLAFIAFVYLSLIRSGLAEV
jgi:hypothetical protein